MNAQANLFGFGEWWEPEWAGMPEFVQNDLQPAVSLKVDFADAAAFADFCRLVDQEIADTETAETRSIWFPKAEKEDWSKQRWIGGPPPAYPVYIISKGRWESRMTARALDRMGVKFLMVVEPGERDQYAAVIDPARLLVLPEDTGGMKGATVARNFVYDHAAASGARWHWCLDDNISWFLRLNRNSKAPVFTGATFRAVEAFVDRYENIAQAGMTYDTFGPRRTKMPPFTLNTRVYSCMLLRNDLPHRFRGRFNDDTDFSLRVLKDGFATVLFNAFQAKKTQTMTMKGGLADTLYKIEDARRVGSEALRELHPDVTQVVFKWGRWHHHVDYRPFKRNQLRRRAAAVVPDGVDEFGMTLDRTVQLEREAA